MGKHYGKANRCVEVHVTRSGNRRRCTALNDAEGTHKGMHQWLSQGQAVRWPNLNPTPEQGYP